MTTLEPPIRVLVVDDSAANRKAITRVLEQSSDLVVIDRAEDGEIGLKKAIELRPDVITLDLEMPRLDGYAFLRLLMSQAPTPVIVLSSYGHPSDVFKALQLGAFDFVAKPATREGSSIEAVRAELVSKIRASRSVRKPTPLPRMTPPVPVPETRVAPPQVPRLVLIGASTGGPPAVQKILEAIAPLPVCALIAQHMPPRFTEAFADRLNQVVPMRVSEAKSGDAIAAGHAFVAPGGAHLEVVQGSAGLSLVVTPGSPSDKHAPSIDRMFSSVARLKSAQAMALVLTGMGSDGAEGVKALALSQIPVWAEAESSAVVFGMPQAAIATGRVARVAPIQELAAGLPAALRGR